MGLRSFRRKAVKLAGRRVCADRSKPGELRSFREIKKYGRETDHLVESLYRTIDWEARSSVRRQLLVLIERLRLEISSIDALGTRWRPDLKRPRRGYFQSRQCFRLMVKKIDLETSCDKLLRDGGFPSETDDALRDDVLDALQRYNDGEYGVCLKCEQAIDEKRLEAIPWVRCCEGCQEAGSYESS